MSRYVRDQNGVVWFNVNGRIGLMSSEAYKHAVQSKMLDPKDLVPYEDLPWFDSRGTQNIVDVGD